MRKVATQPGRPGELGKVREFYVCPKNQGISIFYPKSGKVRELEKILRLEVIVMPTILPNF